MFGKSVQLFKTRIGSYKVNYCLEKKKKRSCSEVVILRKTAGTVGTEISLGDL